MSVWLWVGLLAAVLAGIVLGYFVLTLINKNNELRGVVDKTNHELALLRDSQQGLGLQLLTLERELHRLLQMQASPHETAGGGTLNQIAARLRAGASPGEIVAALGVSDAEVQLVQMIVAKVDAAPDERQPAHQPGEPIA